MRQPRTEKSYTFHIVINNAREVTKAIRIPGAVLPDQVALSTDGANTYVEATDMVSAIQRAYDIVSDAWHAQASNEVIAPCA